MPGNDRAALVTGSTSGLGLAIVLRLARSGYRVTLSYSSDDQQAERALSQVREASPSAVLVKADLGTAAGAAGLVERAAAAHGRLDVLVNNAARVIDGPFLEMTEADWDAVLDVNLKGAFLCSQHAARLMLVQDDGGVILNIGSSTGIRGRRNGVNTCASKAGLMVMTQCLALELAPRIRVNTIVPGLVVTGETTTRFRLDDPAIRREREQAIPLHRLGRPEDIADAVMLLLSPEARFITGQKLVVDGGQNMWLQTLTERANLAVRVPACDAPPGPGPGGASSSLRCVQGEQPAARRLASWPPRPHGGRRRPDPRLPPGAGCRPSSPAPTALKFPEI